MNVRDSIALHSKVININTEIYYSSDSLKEADNITLNVAQQTPEYLASLSDPNTPSHALPLKVNAICAIQRNIAVEKGLVRNARVQIIALHRRFVEVRKLDDNNVHCLPRITFAFQPHGTDWTVIRKQFPLRLAYATTFNSCQGLTLTRAAIDLRMDPFAHRQL